jgi:hypothetical protein
MTKITIDAATFEKLKEVREKAELCDENGRIVGHFVPGPPRDAQGRIIVPFTDKEIDEMAKQSGGRQLTDIFDDLSTS